MKSPSTRVASAVLAAVALLVLVAAAGQPAGKPLQPDKLVILSTTDVKGKSSPCG